MARLIVELFEETPALREQHPGLYLSARKAIQAERIRYAKARNMEGSVAGAGNSFNGDATGATGWIFGYGYNLSKRTSLNLYHVRITNDTNARYVGIVFGGLSPHAGGDPRYTGVGLRHTF